MPFDVPISVYRDGVRVVIGHALVNRGLLNGKTKFIATITDPEINAHIQAGNDFGTAEFVLGEPNDNRTRIITNLPV